MSGPRSKDCFFFSTTDYNYTIAFPQEFSYQVYIQASPLVNTLDFLTQWVRSCNVDRALNRVHLSSSLFQL